MRQLFFQLVGVSFSHHKVSDLELPRFQLGLVLVLHPSLQGFGLDVCLLSNFVQQVQIYSSFLVRLLGHEVLETRLTFLDLNRNHGV